MTDAGGGLGTAGGARAPVEAPSLRALFAAYIVAGAAIASAALALAIPLYESHAFTSSMELTGQGSSLQPMMTLQAWPDYLVVQPGIPLAIFLWIGGLLVAGGAIGLGAERIRRPLVTALAAAGAGVAAAVVGLLVSVPWDPGDVGRGFQRALPGAHFVIESPTAAILSLRVLPGTSIPIGSFWRAIAVVVVAVVVAVLVRQRLATTRAQVLLALACFAVAVVAGAALSAPSITAAVPLGLASAVVVAVIWLPLWAWMRRAPVG